MIKHLIKIDDELFEIPLKVYNHLEQQKQRADELENMWNELKEQLNSVFDKNETHFLEDLAYADVLSKMEQLEKENDE
ncbi:hypothetical protein CW676_08455 [Macrococcoides caseolyticum]|uniref:hypothetical protein n=1 Tax=Macrococcoides caseolyticum TaxID=69966 RepID=UPI000C33D691|nr:hypothetical protein [Macrococcus caseolyticus]PKE52730.1 hypothetical protein CW676_08455 [Macrococcus caseolyticus]PKF38447.1 hypothetical protein CW681_06520 [Macrococcus caseolyticus]